MITKEITLEEIKSARQNTERFKEYMSRINLNRMQTCSNIILGTNTLQCKLYGIIENNWCAKCSHYSNREQRGLSLK